MLVERVLRAGGLRLEPLTAAHAEEMFAVLSDPALHEYMDGAPPALLEALRERYARLESRLSPDGNEHWLNWVVRLADGRAIGLVQATVRDPAGDAPPAGPSAGPRTAWVAYVIAREHGGRGHGTAAVAAMLEFLASACEVGHLLAQVETANARSIRLLARLGFRAATSDEASAHELSETERLYVR